MADKMLCRQTHSLRSCEKTCHSGPDPTRVTSTPMSFPVALSHRPPSIQWEPLPIVRLPGLILWAWYRPTAIPSGIMVAIPPDLVSVYPAGFPMTLADILNAAGVPPHQFQAVSLFGGIWQPASNFAAYINHPLPPVPAGGRAEVLISVFEQAMMPSMPMAAMPQTGIAMYGAQGAPQMENSVVDQNDDSSELAHGSWSDELADDSDFEDNGEPLTDDMMFIRIEAAWKSATQMERQMQGLRQKLSSIQTALGKMDRELTPDERLASDREDRDEWNDARRWLRDLQSKCHKEVKAFDIGMTSGAGGRHHLDEVFTTVIEPRVANSKLAQYRNEFEKYRKDMVSLQRAMVTALAAASQNGTQRAQRVLGKIAGKIREMRVRNREPIGGTNMDRSVRRKR